MISHDTQKTTNPAAAARAKLPTMYCVNDSPIFSMEMESSVNGLFIRRIAAPSTTLPYRMNGIIGGMLIFENTTATTLFKRIKWAVKAANII